MVCLRSVTLPIFVLALLVMPAPVGGLGNHASILVEAPASAAATCQLFVLVNSLVILEMESALGLVTATRGDLESALDPTPPTMESTADCRAVIDEVRIALPKGVAPAASSFVSGPAAVAAPASVVVGPGSEAVACRLAFVINSVIIGGAPFGFPTGEVSGLVELTTASADTGRARCLTQIGEVVMEKGGASA